MGIKEYGFHDFRRKDPATTAGRAVEEERCRAQAREMIQRSKGYLLASITPDGKSEVAIMADPGHVDFLRQALNQALAEAAPQVLADMLLAAARREDPEEEEERDG